MSWVNGEDMDLKNGMEILEDIRAFCLRYKHIYLYGAGMYAMYMQEFLRSELLEIDGHIVSNKENVGNGRLLDIPIYTLDEIKYDSSSCGIILALSEKYHHDVNCALKEHSFLNLLPIFDDDLKKIKEKMNMLSLEKIQAYRIETSITEHEKKENILIVRMDGIGDMVLMTPFFRELRRNYPSANITLVTSPVAFELFEYCPYLDEVHMYDWRRIQGFPLRRKFEDIQRFAQRNLQNHGYSIAIVPRWSTDWYGASFLAFISGAKRSISYSEKVEPEKGLQNKNYDLLFTDLLDERSLKHEVERNMDILLWMHSIVCDTRLELWETKMDQCRINQILQKNVQNGERLVAICISASTDKKKWDIRNYLRLIQSMLDRRWRFVIIGGAEDKESAEELFANIGVINLVGKLSLRETVALMRHVVIYVGNDTGIMHIAAACGVRIVEIRGDDKVEYSTERFHPWGVEYTILQPKNAIKCKDINSIAVDDVMEAVNSLVSDRYIVN